MKVFPVVHIREQNTAVAQAEIAFDSGADGVYLIDHLSGNEETIFSTFNELDSRRDDAYIGMNLLGLSPQNALASIKRGVDSGSLVHAPSGLWIDDIYEKSYPDTTAGNVKKFKDAQEELRSLRILGGIAFKYTPTFTENPDKARLETLLLRDAVDVVTTSGSGTGMAPSVEKIRAMKNVTLGKLAVASGISIDNIAEYKGLVDEVLVASSVETQPYSGIFEKEKLTAFITTAHDLDD